MKRLAFVVVALLAVLVAPAALAGKKSEEKAQKKRDNIDQTAKNTLEKLLAESPKAKTLHDQAFGYAVFDATKVGVGVTGGGGTGVAVAKESGERTYMKVGTGGVGLSIGGKVYQIVFLFQDEKTFQNFVDNGWAAESQATAAAGRAAADAQATFTNGLAYYQLTDAGLMASADIAGTRYWKNPDLNKKPAK
jgi:lipid-binding SYLF domain-containing protein